tara:strand:- start:1564 stop:1734 length:171 start_codon:yes stop_codon:yes gene_type:complete
MCVQQPIAGCYLDLVFHPSVIIELGTLITHPDPQEHIQSGYFKHPITAAKPIEPVF